MMASMSSWAQQIGFAACLSFVVALGVFAPAASAETDDNLSNGVRVVLRTDLGDILVEVYPDKAPAAAGDFLRYVDEGLYKDAAFYRVVRPDNDNGSPVISVIQGGLLDMSAAGAPIPHETTAQTGLLHTDGVLSIGRTEPGTGSAAAFFIVLDDQPSLDLGGMRNPDQLGFASFGRVIEGMDVVRRINALEATAASDDAYTEGQILAPPIRFTPVRPN
jgi:peptidyl-prolyl cis-trans isomerase A (cyclophilin A)